VKFEDKGRHGRFISVQPANQPGASATVNYSAPLCHSFPLGQRFAPSGLHRAVFFCTVSRRGNTALWAGGEELLVGAAAMRGKNR
jgi:hypothetical protein